VQDLSCGLIPVIDPAGKAAASCSAADIAAGAKIRVAADIENKSGTPGKETAQLYIRARRGSIVRRVRELKGFEKTAFAPYEKKTVSFDLGFDELCVWSAAKKYEVEPGEITVTAGPHCRKGVSAAFTLT